MVTINDKPKQSGTRSGKRIADKLFGVLSSMGAGWHDRHAIAAAMGKTEINISEKGALKHLTETGRIEARTVDVSQWIKRLEYRVIVPSDANE